MNMIHEDLLCVSCWLWWPSGFWNMHMRQGTSEKLITMETCLDWRSNGPTKRSLLGPMDPPRSHMDTMDPTRSHMGPMDPTRGLLRAQWTQQGLIWAQWTQQGLIWAQWTQQDLIWAQWTQQGLIWAQWTQQGLIWAQWTQQGLIWAQWTHQEVSSGHRIQSCFSWLIWSPHQSNSLNLLTINMYLLFLISAYCCNVSR